MIEPLNKLIKLSRIYKKIILGLWDLLLSLCSLEIAFLMRLEEWVRVDGKWMPLFVLTPLLTLLIFYAAGLYRIVIRHVTLEAVVRIMMATGVIAVLVWVINYFLLEIPGLPRSLIAIFGIVLLSLVIGSRLSMHMFLLWELKDKEKKTPVAIYGVNKIGVQLATLWKGIDSDYQPSFFIDERPERQSQEVSGLRVYPLQALNKQLRKHCVKDIFVAPPFATAEERVTILNQLSQYPTKVKILPTTVSPGFRAENIRSVQIEDLIGREAVPPNQALLERDITGHNILVTGAGGSIGSSLCEEIMRLRPQKLFIVEQSEYALFRLLNQLRKVKTTATTQIVSFLESVCNQSFIAELFARDRIDVVYHVAAYKHVPLIEENRLSGIANNVLGTKIVAESAVRHKAGCFVLISTDKAVQPTSIMGASKRLAEMIVQSLSTQAAPDTRLCTVRFGNVMGTSGSVIPLFQEQINHGGPVYVTDPHAERYFMTVEEASQLIIQAGAMGRRGEIFLLDMGEAINILEIAKKMIHLSGLEMKENGRGDIEIVYTGLRPGEKLKEQLYSNTDIKATSHPKIKQTMESVQTWNTLSAALLDLTVLIEHREINKIEKLIRDMLPSYQPNISNKRNG